MFKKSAEVGARRERAAVLALGVGPVAELDGHEPGRVVAERGPRRQPLHLDRGRLRAGGIARLGARDRDVEHRGRVARIDRDRVLERASCAGSVIEVAERAAEGRDTSSPTAARE